MPNVKLARMGLLVSTALAIASQFLSAQTPGKIYYVDSANGNDGYSGLSQAQAFATIAHALNQVEADYPNAANGGEAIYVENGSGYPNFKIEGLTATTAKPVIIEGDPNNGANPKVNFTGGYGVSFGEGAAYITLQNFTVIGDAASLTLSGAEAAENSPGGANEEYDGNCIAVDGTEQTGPRPVHITIRHNYVEYCPGGAIATVQADFITIDQNSVYLSSWYSPYGTSGISMLNDYDSIGVVTGSNAANKKDARNFITRNRVFGNYEEIPYINDPNKPNAITDGEGIIIDTNLNTPSTPKISQYPGLTIIENNIIYDNGSSAIEILASDHVLVDHNSTYGNIQDPLNPLPTGWTKKPEFSIINSTGDVTVINNVFESINAGSPPILVSGCTQTDGQTDPGNEPIYLNHNVTYNSNDGTANSLVNSPGITINGTTGIPYYDTPADSSNGFGVSLHVTNSSSLVLSAGYFYLAPAVDFNGTTRTANNSVGAYAENP